MNTPAFDILCFGSITLDIFVTPDSTEVDIVSRGDDDHFCFPVGEKIQVHETHRAPGGGAANTSIGFAKLGLQSAAMGFVGHDDIGSLIRKSLDTCHVSTNLLIPSRCNTSSFSFVLNTEDGRRTIFHYRNCQEDFDPAHLLQAPAARAIYMGHQYGQSEDMLAALPEWKEKNDGLIAWNPGKTQFKQGLKAFMHIFPCIDMLLLNVEEAEQFTGLEASYVNKADATSDIIGENVPLPTEYKVDQIADVRPLAQEFLKAGVPTVIITDSKRGAQAFTQDNTHLYIPTYDVEIVSTLGAGDSFSVGMVAAALYGKPLAEQLIWGATNASSVIQHMGAQAGQMTLDEMEQKLS